jgi:hypothetical protein
MTLVSTVTVGAGGSTSIDFTSIPQTATDLMLFVSARSNFSANYVYLNLFLNNSTTSITARNLLGTGSGVNNSTNPQIEAGVVAANSTSNTFSNVQIYIPNYAGSTNKSWSADAVVENNATAGFQSITAGVWSNTAAVNQVTLQAGGTTFQQYTTASLYAITKGSGGATVS